MVSVGSVSIDLTLNRSQFDNDLRKLSQENVGELAIPAKLQLDTRDIERQIKGLTGFLPTLSIPIELDDKKFRQQLQGIQDATKNLGSISLDIDPDIDGLKRKLKAINNIDVELFEVELDPDIEGFNKKVNDALNKKAYSTTVGLETSGFQKSIEESFEKALKKVEGKNLFSSIGNAFKLPFNLIGGVLQETLNGVFLGFGLPLGEKLGHGIASGLEANFGEVIGSFELLGENLVTKAAPKLGNTVGGRIAGAILNSQPLLNLRNNLTSLLDDVIGESERLIESRATAQESRNKAKQRQSLAQQNIGQELKQSIDRAPQRQAQIQKIREKNLPAAQEEIAANQKIVSQAESNQALRLARISPFADNLDDVIEKTNFQIDKASLGLTQAIVKEKTLQQLITLLQTETSRTAEKAKTAGANTSAIDEIQSALKETAIKGQQLIARQDSTIQIEQANLKEANSRIKLYRQQEQQLREESNAVKESGDIPSAYNLLLESKKSGIRANAAQNEALDYKNKIKQSLETRAEILNSAVAERKNLRQSLDKEIANLADTLIGTDDPVAPKRRRPRTKKQKESQQASTAPVVVEPSTEIPDSPQIFKDIAAQFSQISQIQIPSGRIPQLARGAEGVGFRGKYTSFDNEITLRPDLYSELQQGVVSPETVKTIIHELRHALQTDFGKRILTESGNPDFELIKANPEEQQKLGSRIQESADFFKKNAFGATPADVETVKKLEEDAYVFAERYFQEVFHNITNALQSSVRSGGLPSEAELVAQIEEAQATITANLKQSFKGRPRDRKVINQPLAETTLTDVDQQIAFLSQQLERDDLSGEVRQKLGRSKGVLERQYRSYSPALRALQPGSNVLSQESQAQVDPQSVKGFELFEVDPIEQELQRVKERVARLAEIKKGSAPTPEIKRIDQILSKIESLSKDFDQYSRATIGKIADDLESNQIDADIALQRLERLAKRGERRANRNIRNIIQNSESSGSRADIALKQLSIETDQQINQIQSGIDFDEANDQRRTRRRIRKIQRGYGLNVQSPSIETEAPSVEKPLPTLDSGNIFQQIGREFNRTRLDSLSKQAQALSQQAAILLADIETQITLGKSAQQEAKLVEQQIKQNEKELESILNQIERANSGKEPPLTPGDLQRLSGRAQTFTTRIDEDKERLAGLQPTIQNGKELEPVAKDLRTAQEGAVKSVQQQDIKGLESYNAELRKILAIVGEQPPNNFFDELINGVGKLDGLLPNALSLLKGFFAFQAFNVLQSSLSQVTTEAFKAYVEFDKLKTALNFASGGTAGGAANLKFVREQVEQLGIPLQASVQGFTQLASAARNTALEGQQTKELFTGISQASTVLSLSAEDTTGAIGALEKILSEGKVSSEALRQELGTRIPGAFSIAARAVGVTEEEFTRLLETGQVLSQDFIPKFSKQLQSEFGEGSKTASDNAQSALFKLQNSFQTFQQGVGEGIAPVAVPGIKALAVVLDVAAKASKELLAILASVAVVLSLNVANALRAVVANLILANASTLTLGGAFQTLGKTINNSLGVQIGVGIFALIEIIRLLQEEVSSDLVKSFDEAAQAAVRAADASEKAFEEEQNRRLGKKTAPEKEEPPRAAGGVGRFVDNYLINPANFVIQHTFTDVPLIPTNGQNQRDTAIDREKVEVDATKKLLSGAKLREQEIERQSGELGQLPGLDQDLRDKSKQRQILQAQAKRDYTDKGLPIPPDIQTKLTLESTDINTLTNKRGDITKPYNDTLAALNQQINYLKAQKEQLNRPASSEHPVTAEETLGRKRFLEVNKEIDRNREALLKQKSSLETTLAAFNVNPILAFIDAFRKLNLVYAEAEETNKQRAASRNLQSAQESFSGFATNRLAGKQRTLTDAITARDVAKADAENQQDLLDGLNEQLNAPGLQPDLQRLGVSPTSSVAQVEDILNNTKDESDKAILEKIKAVRQQELKTTTAKQTAVDANAKVQQVTQENTLDEIQFGAEGVQARVQQIENLKTAAVKKGLESRTISETEAAEKIARIQLSSTEAQQRSIGIQLKLLNEYHAQGKIGAEQFAQKQRELTTEQTSLQEQQAERQLAVFDAANARKLEMIELLNKKAEADINEVQSSGTIAVKNGILSGQIDTIIKAPQEQNTIDQENTRANIALIKIKIDQNKFEKEQRIITAKQATENEIALNQQLAQADIKLVDLQIQAQEQYRAEIEHNFQIEKQRLDLRTAQATTEVKKGILFGELDTIQAPEIQNIVDQNAAISQVEFIKSEIAKTKELRDKNLLSARAANEKELALNIELAQANQNLIDKQIQAQEQYRAAIEKTFQRRKDQLALETSQASTGIQQGFLEQFKAPLIDEKGLELTKTGATLNNQSASTAQQISILQEQLAGVDKLKLAEKDAADKRQQLNSEIETLRQQQIQTEIDLIKNKQEIEINGIERAKTAEENRFKLVASDLEQEKAKIELVSQSLERSKTLLESRANLSKASSDLAVSSLEIRKDNTNRALDLSRKLEDPSIDGRLKSVIVSQLGSLGFSVGSDVQGNEVKILEQRAKIEDEIAKKKLEALKTEQAYQKQSLELDLKKQAIAAQTAVFEAESGKLQAAKSQLEAEAELRKAQIRKDPLEIATAKVGLEIANRDIELSDRKLQFAKEGLSVQDELARNAEAAQEATQQTALSQQVASAAAQKQATALERVEALVKPLGKGGGTDGSRDWVNPFIPLKGETQYDYDTRIVRAKMTGQIQESFNTTNVAGAGITVTPATGVGAIPPVDTTGAQVKATEITPPDTTTGYNKFVDALKGVNQGVEQRLDKLLDSFRTFGNSPRSLTVTTPNPVDDAAAIMNDLLRGELVGAGL